MIHFGGVWKEPLMAGRVYDVPEELALDMIDDGRAIAIGAVETTTRSASENTAKRTGKAKRR